MPEYETLESTRARRLSVTVHDDGRIVVTKPMRVSAAKVETFMRDHAEWVAQTLARIERRHAKYGAPIELPRPRKGLKAYTAARKVARTLVAERLRHFNETYGFRYGAISIRDQKTRWGSCSSTNNLSFNYRIAFLPSALADYVIVHELCHTKEHNHTERFWAQVARTVPDHQKLRKELVHRYMK